MQDEFQNIEEKLTHLAKLSGLKINTQDVNLQSKLSSIISLIDEVKDMSFPELQNIQLATILTNNLDSNQNSKDITLFKSTDYKENYSLQSEGCFLAPKSIS